jgi:hypothetical protein
MLECGLLYRAGEREAFMKTIIAASALLVIGALGVPTHAARHEPVERFVAQSALMTSPSRITFRPVEVEIFEWSTALNHHELATALLQKGHVAFFNLLCGFGQVGRISVIGAPDIAIRYAWSTGERRGSRRIYVATEEPVLLSGSFGSRFPDAEPLTFIELRLSGDGTGEGKLSDVARLSVDESRNVIELRDYDRRPLHLIGVRSLVGNHVE